MENSNATFAEAGEQLVTFSLSGEELAVPIGMVQEIVRRPEITKVPNAPAFVEGIGNLRGNILPIVNLRTRLGMDAREADDATRVVVLSRNGSTTGIVVDSVAEVLHVEKDTLEAPPNAVAAVDGHYLRGVAKVDSGKRLVMILSVDKVLPDSLAAMAGTAGPASRGGAASEKASARSVEEEEHLVTFMLAEEEFALDIMQVQEIIRVTEITAVPKAPAFVKGLMALRNRLIPIIDLRKRFELGAGENGTETDARRIMVVDIAGVLSGILVDSVSEVLTLAKSHIEPPPAIISSAGSSRLRGVGKLDSGDRLLMLLDVAKLVSEDEREQLGQAAGQDRDAVKGAAKEMVEERQVVCFRIQKEEFGMDIMRVQEIIRIGGITAVPRAPAFVEGIVNLRSDVLPVIDIRKRFGLTASERSEQNRIMVVDMGGRTTGLIVDSVSEVLRIAKADIESPPAIAASGNGRFIEGIGKLNQGKRIVMLVDADAILDAGEQALAQGMELAALKAEP